jgi:hypothetical protein
VPKKGPKPKKSSKDHGALITVLPADVRQLEESDSSLFVNIRREGVRVV